MDPGVVTSDAADFSKLIVEFYMDAVLDEKETNGWFEEIYIADTQELRKKFHPGKGRPIYRDAEHIEIRIPGNLKEIRRRQVRESDKRLYAREYAAFQQTRQNPIIGTPLDRLPFLTKAQVLEFQALGIRTAENLRDVSDADGQKFMGWQGLKRRVVSFLTAAEGGVPLAALQSELEQRDAQIAALKAQMAEITKSEKRK